MQSLCSASAGHSLQLQLCSDGLYCCYRPCSALNYLFGCGPSELLSIMCLAYHAKATIVAMHMEDLCVYLPHMHHSQIGRRKDFWCGHPNVIPILITGYGYQRLENSEWEYRLVVCRNQEFILPASPLGLYIEAGGWDHASRPQEI